MDGGNKVIGLWRNRNEHAAEDAARTREALADQLQEALAGVEDDAPRPGRWRRPAAIALCAGGALAWTGFYGWAQWMATGGQMVAPDVLAAILAGGVTPLLLFAMLWLLLLRTSRAESDRYEQVTRSLRSESERIDALLTFVSARIEANRRELSDQGVSLLGMGDEAAKRLGELSAQLSRDIEAISQHAGQLKGTAAATRGDLAVLLSNLPKAQVQMRNIATALTDAGAAAQKGVSALGGEILALGLKSQEARGLAETAGVALSEQVTRLNTLAAELQAMVDQGHTQIVAAGDEASSVLAAKVGKIGVEIERIGSLFSAQDEASKALITGIEGGIASIEERFADLDRAGVERTERLGLALSALRNHAVDLKDALAAGGDTANGLTEKTQSLMTALDAAAREIDETLPAAYARLEEAADRAVSTARSAGPVLETIEAGSTMVVKQLASSEEIITRQRDALGEMAHLAAHQLTASRSNADELAGAIAAASHEARMLTDAAGGQLVEALLRARDAARQAAENARETLAAVIPESARAIGEQSKTALAEALTQQVEAQMAEIAATTERAVATAQQATDRLMRQMLTISETSAALEARISEAKEEAERGDQDNFARRVALLIESLNSTAIDVTKILSNDVTDSAWAAYLRGDRGIFARRAVKLLDNGEAREIARHYQEEPEFREQVNRYIHDYESMLRSVMATRDGTPLSVALLSSDTGKLYVALAQAIERLRA